MNEPIEYELTAKDQDLEAALRKNAKLAEGLGKALDNAGQRGKRDEATKVFQEQEKQLKKSNAELDRFVAKEKELIKTPLEQLTAKQEKLNLALKQGKLTQDEYSRALNRSTQEIYKQSSSGNALTSMMGQYASGVGVMTMGVKLLTTAWEEADEAARKGLESVRALEDPNKDLAQLATDDMPYPKLKQKRDSLAVSFNLDRREATDTMFAAESAGLSAEDTQVAARAGVIGDASDTALLMGKVREIYGDDIKPAAAINVAGAAAAKYPLNFKDFVQHMPTAMGAGKALGLSFEEVSSIVGNMSTQTGTPAEAFARFGNLAGKMARYEQFAGKGMAGFEQVAAMDKSQQEALFNKDQETDQAIRYIRGRMGSIQQDVPLWQQANRATGTNNDWLVGRARAKLSDPADRAVFTLGQQEKAAEIARERHAAKEALRQSAAVQNQSLVETTQANPLSRWAAGGWGSVGRWLKTVGAPEDIITSWATAMTGPDVLFRQGPQAFWEHNYRNGAPPAGVGIGAATGVEVLGPKLDAILGTLNAIKQSNAAMVPGPAPRIPPRPHGNGRP